MNSHDIQIKKDNYFLLKCGFLFSLFIILSGFILTYQSYNPKLESSTAYFNFVFGLFKIFSGVIFLPITLSEIIKINESKPQKSVLNK